jgi:hypothetical protein
LIEGNFFQVLCLRRDVDPSDFSYSQGTYLFLLGEPYARIQTNGKPLGKGRLSAETLLKSYLEIGTKMLDAVKGNYSIVLISEIESTLQLLTSHFGISPLYYAFVGQYAYFSTSVAEIAQILPGGSELDHTAIVETMLINWPMHERTLLRDVKCLSGGTILKINLEGVSRQVYWDLRDLFSVQMLAEDVALEQGSDLFYRCANTMVEDQQKICASFTSGFDSRVLHSVLQKDHQDILSYSFGISRSLNVSIPQKICADLGYPFEPVYLDQAFDKVYVNYAHQTVALSDGLVLQRANYAYAFHKISDYAQVVITGLFGSELLRTFQNVGNAVSLSFMRMNEALEPVKVLQDIIVRRSHASYLTSDTFVSSQEEFVEDISAWFDWCRGFNANGRFFLYYIKEVARRWFGAEVSTERVYATNRFPYFDDEFVELMFRAPFAGIYTQPAKPTVNDRFKSQYFYAYIIRKYRPELLHYPTDHGYSPMDILFPSSLLVVGPKHLWSRYWKKATRYREFKPKEWLLDFYGNYFFPRVVDRTGLVSPRYQADFQNGKWFNHVRDFDQVGALWLWYTENVLRIKESNHEA